MFRKLKSKVRRHNSSYNDSLSKLSPCYIFRLANINNIRKIIEKHNNERILIMASSSSTSLKVSKIYVEVLLHNAVVPES